MQNDRITHLDYRGERVTGYRCPRVFSHWVHEVPIEETRRVSRGARPVGRNDVPTNTVPSRRHGTNWQADEKLQLVDGRDGRGEGKLPERGSRETLSHTVSASSSDRTRSLCPAHALALRHHLVVRCRTLANTRERARARARRLATPVVDRREEAKRAREAGKERGATNGTWRRGSAKAGVWGRGCKICCRNGVADECGRP